MLLLLDAIDPTSGRYKACRIPRSTFLQQTYETFLGVLSSMQHPSRFFILFILRSIFCGVVGILITTESLGQNNRNRWQQQIRMNTLQDQIDVITSATQKLPTVLPSTIEGDFDLCRSFNTAFRFSQRLQKTPEYTRLAKLRGPLVTISISFPSVTNVQSRWVIPFNDPHLVSKMSHIKDIEDLRKYFNTPLFFKFDTIREQLIQRAPLYNKAELHHMSWPQLRRSLTPLLYRNLHASGFQEGRFQLDERYADRDQLFRLMDHLDDLNAEAVTIIFSHLQSGTSVSIQDFKDFLSKHQLATTADPFADPSRWFRHQLNHRLAWKQLPAETALTPKDQLIKLQLVETTQWLAWYRGFIGDDCASFFMANYAFSPMERVFVIKDKHSKKDLGYLQMTSIDSSGRNKNSGTDNTSIRSAYLHTIAGSHLHLSQVEAIFHSMKEIGQQLGYAEVLLPKEDQLKKLMNEPMIRSLFLKYTQFDEKVPIQYLDQSLRRSILRNMGTYRTTDDPAQNEVAFRMQIPHELLPPTVQISKGGEALTIRPAHRKGSFELLLHEMTKHFPESAWESEYEGQLLQHLSFSEKDAEELLQLLKNTNKRKWQDFIGDITLFAKKRRIPFDEAMIVENQILLTYALRVIPDIKSQPELMWKALEATLRMMRLDDSASELRALLARFPEILEDTHRLRKLLRSIPSKNFDYPTQLVLMDFAPEVMMQFPDVLPRTWKHTTSKDRIWVYLFENPQVINRINSALFREHFFTISKQMKTAILAAQRIENRSTDLLINFEARLQTDPKLWTVYSENPLFRQSVQRMVIQPNKELIADHAYCKTILKSYK